MNTTVLLDTKQSLGIAPSVTAFDGQLLDIINSITFVLFDIGFTENPVEVTEATTWDDFPQTRELPAAKRYIYDRVRLRFDPPQSSSLMGALQSDIDEFEYRIYSGVDSRQP